MMWGIVTRKPGVASGCSLRWLAVWGLMAGLAGCSGGLPPPEPEAPEVVDVGALVVHAVADGAAVVGYTERRQRNLGDGLAERWLLRVAVDGSSQALSRGPGPASLLQVPAEASDGRRTWGLRRDPQAQLCHQRPASDPAQPPDAVCHAVGSRETAGAQLVHDGVGTALAVLGLDATPLPAEGPLVRSRLMVGLDVTSPANVPMLPDNGGRRWQALALPGQYELLWTELGRNGPPLLQRRDFENLANAWGAPVVLGTLAADDALWAAAASRVPGSPRQMVVWCDAQGARAARRLHREAWAALPAPPWSDCNEAQALTLRLSDSGNVAVAAWSRPVTGGPRAWQISLFDGTDWSAAQALDLGVDSELHLGVDGSGRVALAHFSTASFLGQPRQLVLRRWSLASGLGPVELRAEVVGTRDQTVALGVGQDGHAVLAWARPAGGDDPGSRLGIGHHFLGDERVLLQAQVLGGGSLSSAPAGLQCPGSCEARFSRGRSLEITAVADAGQQFAGWSGSACVGNRNPLVLTLEADGTCVARFVPLPQQPRLQVDVVGEGRVTSTPVGLDCANSCSAGFAAGSVVQLRALPAAGQRFVAFGGDAGCASGQVTLGTPDSTVRCSAQFERDPDQVVLELQVAGGGRVQSAPAGLDCGGSCRAWWPRGSVVTLTSSAPPDTTPSWRGDGGCSGSAPAVTLSLDQDQRCSLDFVPLALSRQWVATGGVAQRGNFSGPPALARSAGGQLGIAFLRQGTESLRELIVARLVLGAWSPYGAQPLNDSFVSANPPSLAYGPDEQPVVAWADARARIQVRRWDGSAWQVLARDLSLRANAVTSEPRIAVAGNQLVVAFHEFDAQGRAGLVVLRHNLVSGGAWSGGQVPGVSSASDGPLRLVLASDGSATVAYQHQGAGGVGELPLRVVQESGGGWSALCGPVGPGHGTSFANTRNGFGLAHLADGSTVVVQPSADETRVQQWRCQGGAWAPFGADQGSLLQLPGFGVALYGVAAGGGPGDPVAVVLSGAARAGLQVDVFALDAGGATPIGFALVLPMPPGDPGQLAALNAAGGSPLVGFGEGSLGSPTLRSYQWMP